MTDGFDFDALRGIGLGGTQRQDLQSREWPPAQFPARVAEVQRDRLLLHDGRALAPANVCGALLRQFEADDDALAAGDWVVASAETPAAWQVLARLPRLNQITRRTNDGHHASRRQALVANIDTALLVMGLDHDFNLRRLERYLALARLAGVPAVLVLTKADTVDPGQREWRLTQVRDVLPPEVEAMALDGREPGVNLWLAPWLVAGQTLVLLGSSGAGKSTLTKTLVGAALDGALPATGAVRGDDGRGRHTTSARTLYRTPAGACIIDTPGLRALRLDVDDGADLAVAFDDVARLAPQCRFRDCQHQQEPGCAVRQGVPDERLRNFHKLLREAKRDRLTVLERQAQVAQWKARGRAAHLNRRARPR